MSGLEVIGGISAIITLVEASIKVFDNARKDLKLSEAFIIVRRRLPIIVDTLKTCQDHLASSHGSFSSEVGTALEQTLDACDDKAGKLRELFEKVIPGENDDWQKRYAKILKKPGKGRTVERLMLAIAEDVQLIVNHQAVKSATAQQIADLEDTIKDMNAIQPSELEDGMQNMNFNSNGGAQTINAHSHIGQQINNNASVGNQYFGSVTISSKHDFSFKDPIGIHLGQAPYIDPEFFVGRSSELEQMKEVLKPGSQSRQQRRLVVGGIGGIGKTQLLIAYVNLHRDEYSSAFWLNASSQATLNADYMQIARQIFGVLETEGFNSEQAVMHVQRWLSDRRNTQWLLMFDNHDDPKQYQLQKYIPPASHGALVITTRRPDQLTGQKIQVKPLHEVSDSIEILATRSGREGTRSDPHAMALAERLGGLPLALATAGAYLQTSHLTFQSYLQEYEARWNIDPHDVLELQEYQDRTLYTTWRLSYTRLEAERPPAASFLRLLAYFDNQSIWYKLLCSGTSATPDWLRDIMTSEMLFGSMMRTLTNYCFLELHQSTQTWSMHNCVHDWTLVVLNEQADAKQYEYAVTCIASSIDFSDYENFGHVKYTKLAAHGVRLVHHRFWNDKHLTEMLSREFHSSHIIASLLQSQVRLSAAEKLFIQALTGKEKALGIKDVSYLKTLNNLGVLYTAEAKLEDGEKMLVRTLAGYEEILGWEDQATINAAHNLGLNYRQQGRLQEAENLYLRATSGFRKVLGPGHERTMTAMINLCALFLDQGKLDAADQIGIEVLAQLDKTNGFEYTTLHMLNNLGPLYRAQGKFVEAEHAYTQALAKYQEVVGSEHPTILGICNNLGAVYVDLGKLAEAEQMYKRVIVGYEKVLGQEHTLTLGTYMNTSLLYSRQGKLVEAEQLIALALAGYEKALGPQHRLTLNATFNSGVIYAAQGKLVTAEQMYRRALAGYQNTFGPEHISTLDTLNNLAWIAVAHGKLSAAEQLYKQAIAGYKKSCQPGYPALVRSVNNLNVLYNSQEWLERDESSTQAPEAESNIEVAPIPAGT